MWKYLKNRGSKKIEHPRTLKDVREVKPVLLLYLQPLDEAEHHFCFFAFADYIKLGASDEIVKQADSKMKKMREELSDEEYFIVNYNNMTYRCYLGEFKPKHIPHDYKTREIDFEKLISTIHNMSVILKGRHHAAIYLMIKHGKFGKGQENMKQSDYRKMMKRYGFNSSLGKSNLSESTNENFDYLYFKIPIFKKNGKYNTLTEKDNKNIEKEHQFREFCCHLIDNYWQQMVQ